MKKREQHVWTWPIAGYLFLGGLGSSISIIVAVADLFFEKGSVLSAGLIIAIVALGLGSFLLIFELGRPLQFWRVFSKQKAVLTFGAWAVSTLLIFDLVYLSCFIEWFPWYSLSILRLIVAIVTLLVGVGVLMYTGVELSSMKGRVLWNTPLLPLLFSLSGLLTGVAGCSLIVGVWPYHGTEAEAVTTITALRIICIILLVVVLITVFIYTVMTYTSTSETAQKAMKRWFKGSYAPAFWGGLIGIGLVLPLVLLIPALAVLDLLSYVLIIAGGAFLRFLVVYSDDRQQISGESFYWQHLPKGDEEFIRRNWG